MPTKINPIVWSSEQGDLRKSAPGSAIKVSIPPQQQTVYLHRDSKGRAGKGVVLLKGLQLSSQDMSALARSIKQACGTGGAVKNGVIEIQGDQREKLARLLKNLGYKVKIAGG